MVCKVLQYRVGLLGGDRDGLRAGRAGTLLPSNVALSHRAGMSHPLHPREQSQEVMTVRSQEQGCDILILYSLKRSCASNVFSMLISVYALKIMAPASS